MYIDNKYYYLNEVPYFKENGLPSGYLINKGKVGCGGTTIALEDKRDTIICVPYKNLIENKTHQYNKDSEIILGVYEGVSKKDIKDYIDTHKIKKIMCTYDSLKKVSEVSGFNYYLLVDELHILFTDYSFRNEAIKSVLSLYSKFKEWTFMTATPIEDDLMLEELKDIPKFNIEWANKTEITVKAVKCKQVVNSIRKIINDFLNNKIFGNAHIFINSVDTIASIITNCDLDESNTRIIFSKYNKKYGNMCKGIKNGHTTDEVKKINLYTSTCFEGCDLYDEYGKIYVISEGSKSQTLYDISTRINQIAGRIRNTHFKNITHLYSSTRYNNDLTYEQFKEVVLDEEKKAKSYINRINQDKELINGTKESSFIYVYKDEDGFKFDPNLMKLDIFNYKCFHTYTLITNIQNEYQKNGIKVETNIDNTSDKLLKDNNTRTTFKDAIIEYDNLVNSLYPFKDGRLSLLRNKYPYIDKAYKVLGMDKIKEMKYMTSNIQRVLVKKDSMLDNRTKIYCLLKKNPKFKLGMFITGKECKQMLKEIYSYLGITVKESVKDMKDFCVLQEKVKRIDGKLKKGYIISYIK